MISWIIQVVTLIVLPLTMFTACAAWPWDECGTTERAVLAEFPLYGGVSIAPAFNPKHSGCVLAYGATGSPEQVLTYFTEQLEAHDWSGAPHFASGEHELSAYRDHFRYGVRVDEGGQLSGQELPPGALMVSVAVEERLETVISGYEPNADFARIEMSEEELERFIGEFGLSGRVEAVVTLIDGQLQIRRPGRLANNLIPVGPARFRIADFSNVFAVEFEMSDGEVSRMKIEQTFTGMHSGGGTMPTYVELVPVQ